MKIDYDKTSCQFYQVTNNETIVNFPHGLNGKAEVKKEFMFLSFKVIGIVIPLEDRAHFSNKSIVYLDDKEFGKAFRDIYAQNFDSDMYKWKANG